jgi:hypothetical protein
MGRAYWHPQRNRVTLSINTMSSLASLSLLLAVNFAAQDTNRLVSAEVRAASAPIAIADLAKQIGYPLEAMPSTAEDRLVVRVNKVPIHTLMDKIAKTLNAEWEQTATGYRLVRNDQIRRKELAEEQERLAGRIKESMVGMKKRLDEDGELTQRKAELAAQRLQAFEERQRLGEPMNDWKAQQQLRQMAPVYRIMRNLVPSISPELLASVPRGRTVVFCTKPPRMQKQMPADLSRLMGPFLAEQKIWAIAMKTAREKRGSQAMFYDENGQDPGERKTGKVILKIGRSSRDQGLSVRLTVADTKGRMMANGYENLGWSWESLNESLQKANKDSEKEEAIKFTGISKEISDTIREAYEKSANGRREPTFNISPQVREIFMNIDKYEPLSYVATDALFEIGRIKNLNVVACPTDEMMLVAGFGGGKDPKPSTVLAMARNFAADFSIADGWLQLKPVEPSVARARRTNRGALANYIRRTAKEGRLTLENKATFANASGQEDEDYLPMFYLQFLGLISNNSEYSDWTALRLYGSLSANQWRAAKSGQPIPFRSLQPNQLEIIRHMVFDRDYSPIQISYQQEDMADRGSEDGVFYGGGLDQEPTEILPNGFTGNEMVQITETIEERLFGKPESDSGNGIMWGEQSMNADSLAYEIIQTERPELFPWRNQPGYQRPAISKYRMGTDRQIQFLVQFTRRASLNQQLIDRTYTTKEAVAYDKLPADLRKKVDAAVARLREAYKNQKAPNWNPGNGGATPPPPPR